MATLGAGEATTHRPGSFKRVESGEHIAITPHGRPVAALKGFARGRRRGDFDVRAAISSLHEAPCLDLAATHGPPVATLDAARGRSAGKVGVEKLI